MIHLESTVCESSDCVTEKDVSEIMQTVDKERTRKWLELGWNSNCRMGPLVLFFNGISAFVSVVGPELPIFSVTHFTMTLLLESEKQRYRPSLLQLICSMLRKPWDM